MVCNAKGTDIRQTHYLRNIVVFCAIVTTPLAAQSARPRARDIGIAPGVFTPGPTSSVFFPAVTYGSSAAPLCE